MNNDPYNRTPDPAATVLGMVILLLVMVPLAIWFLSTLGLF